MDEYARIEPETEVHRTTKALRRLAPEVRIPLENGSVEIRLDPDLEESPVAQQITATLVNLLLRMKGIVTRLHVVGAEGGSLSPGVPLIGPSLSGGLHRLADSLQGPLSEFVTVFSTDKARRPDLIVAIGHSDGDIVLGADAWRALLGSYTSSARWEDQSPLGSILAATIGSAEVFKRLLRRATGWSEGHLLNDLAFSLWNLGVDADAEVGGDIAQVQAEDLAVAGAGAGGTAFLYTLMSFPAVTGRLTVVEPEMLKASNLGRYLMADYNQVHAPVHKLDSVNNFSKRHAANLEIESIEAEWHEIGREWTQVIVTVDTPEARRDVQRSKPREILEAGVVLGTLYAVLRVVKGGWCLECKHPHDPDVTWRKRALRWGTSIEDVKQRYARRVPVTREDLQHLAKVQNRPIESLFPLEGMPFDEVPTLTECGETPLSLKVPSQAPVLPFATTGAGVVLAAECVKNLTGRGALLRNYFAHDLRFRPRTDRHVFKRRRLDCPACPEA